MRIKHIIILVGAPCSGKTTWLTNYTGKSILPWEILSRDIIREQLRPGKYTFSSKLEEQVNDLFLDGCKEFLQREEGGYLILDNTHCKQKYFDAMMSMFKEHYVIFKTFEVSLTKSYIRNIERWWKTGKWIPFKVIWNMKKGYKQLNFPRKNKKLPDNYILELYNL